MGRRVHAYCPRCNLLAADTEGSLRLLDLRGPIAGRVRSHPVDGLPRRVALQRGCGLAAAIVQHDLSGTTSLQLICPATGASPTRISKPWIGV